MNNNQISQENIDKFWEILNKNEGWCPLQFVFGLISIPPIENMNNISLESKQNALNFLKQNLTEGRLKINWSENEDGKIKQIHNYDEPELADKMYKDILNTWINEQQVGQTELTVQIIPVK
jgi:hypothetical protein